MNDDVKKACANNFYKVQIEAMMDGSIQTLQYILDKVSVRSDLDYKAAYSAVEKLEKDVESLERILNVG